MLKHRGQLFMWITILTSPSTGGKMNWKYYFLWMDRAALQQWSSTVPRTVSVQWLILLKVWLIQNCRKKRDNEIWLMLCEIDEPFIYFPKLNFLCLEISWPIPFLMFVLLRNALVTCQVQNSSNTSIIEYQWYLIFYDTGAWYCIIHQYHSSAFS